MKKEHQKHAAQCRHAKANEAKRIYCQKLSECFQNWASLRPSLPPEERLNAFASDHRRRNICDYVSQFGFKESTFRAWLREWKTLTYLSALH